MELLETILQHVEFYGKIILSIGATLCAIGLIAVAIWRNIRRFYRRYER